MINKKTGKRELAYIARVEEVRTLDGYDNVYYARINGWNCVVSKQIKSGDEVVFFEPDSLLPKDDKRFDFMARKKHRVKVQKICRVISQGLALSKSAFPELKKLSVGDFVTDILNVRHFEYDTDDVSKTKCKKDINNKLIGVLLRFKPFMCLYNYISNKRNAAWPSFVSKTDQERIANVSHLLKNKDIKWIATEKVDGCSTTYAVERKLFEKKYYVCSRNIVLDNSDNAVRSIWWENYIKYNIRNKLDELLSQYNAKNIAIQGESYGNGVQRRTYSLQKHDWVLFHIWIDGKQLPMDEAVKIAEQLELPHVHIYYTDYTLPNTVQELEDFVEQHKSFIDGKDLEGMVFYDKSNKESFKCVSPNYLIKYHNG